MDEEPHDSQQHPGAGGPESRGDLLARNLDHLRAIIRRRAGPLVKARESDTDLVQSVCREALRSFSDFSFQGERAFRVWLTTLATRKLVEKNRYYAASKRGQGRSGAVAPAGGDSSALDFVGARSAGPSPSEAMVQREEVDLVVSAITRLPANYREVIMLSRFLGFTHDDIAALLGETEPAIRNRLHRALARLMTLMSEPGSGGSAGAAS